MADSPSPDSMPATAAWQREYAVDEELARLAQLRNEGHGMVKFVTIIALYCVMMNPLLVHLPPLNTISCLGYPVMILFVIWNLAELIRVCANYRRHGQKILFCFLLVPVILYSLANG